MKRLLATIAGSLFLTAAFASQHRSHLPPGAGWTTFWLTDHPSKVAGYKALWLTQSCGPTREVVTPTVEGGSMIQAPLQWISPPISTDYTWISWNIGEWFEAGTWGAQDRLDTNATYVVAWSVYRNGVEIYPLGITGGSLWELTRTVPQDWFQMGAAMALESGDRIIYKIYIDRVGTMHAGSVRTWYNGSVPGENGDSWFSLPIRAGNPPPVFVVE